MGERKEDGGGGGWVVGDREIEKEREGWGVAAVGREGESGSGEKSGPGKLGFG